MLCCSFILNNNYTRKHYQEPLVSDEHSFTQMQPNALHLSKDHIQNINTSYIYGSHILMLIHC